MPDEPQTTKSSQSKTIFATIAAVVAAFAAFTENGQKIYTNTLGLLPYNWSALISGSIAQKQNATIDSLLFDRHTNKDLLKQTFGDPIAQRDFLMDNKSVNASMYQGDYGAIYTEQSGNEFGNIMVANKNQISPVKNELLRKGVDNLISISSIRKAYANSPYVTYESGSPENMTILYLMPEYMYDTEHTLIMIQYSENLNCGPNYLGLAGGDKASEIPCKKIDHSGKIIAVVLARNWKFEKNGADNLGSFDKLLQQSYKTSISMQRYLTRSK